MAIARDFVSFAVALVIVSVLSLFYVKRLPLVTASVPREADSAQSSTEPVEPQDSALADTPSAEPAKQVLAGLKSFQGKPKMSMTYEEYDQMLTNLKTDLNNTLPAFARHGPSDEKFRQEVTAALRDYVAAGNWWKTTIMYSKVLKDSDRTERLKAQWDSAQAHLEKAEKLLNTN